MQDKDFDKLFSSKFDDFETEPSPMVWENITGELDGKKVKRPLISYLSIAAGIAVVFTAGWLLVQKGAQPVEKHHNYANLVQHDTARTIAAEVTKPAVTKPEPAVIERISGDKVVSNNSYRPKATLTNADITAPVVDKPDAAVKQSQPVVNANPPVIAQNTAQVTTAIKPIMPDMQLAPKAAEVITITPVEKPTVIASAENQQDEQEPENKHRIHNLGGLINALVSKVDKRSDKLIEFKDEDDDDAGSRISSVNLGLFKLGKH